MVRETKCSNCKGIGCIKVSTDQHITGTCYYCLGTGTRNKKYTRNKND